MPRLEKFTENDEDSISLKVPQNLKKKQQTQTKQKQNQKTQKKKQKTPKSKLSKRKTFTKREKKNYLVSLTAYWV